MKTVLIRAAVLAAIIVPSTPGIAQTTTPMSENGLVVVDSNGTVPDTEKRLLAALEQAGLKVAARIDHAANAQSADMKLAPTVLFIFGNPKVGTQLMEKTRQVGIDLPLKILIWEENGKVKVAYNDPAYLARRHGLEGVDPAIGQIGGAMKKLSGAAAGQ